MLLWLIMMVATSAKFLLNVSSSVSGFGVSVEAMMPAGLSP